MKKGANCVGAAKDSWTCLHYAAQRGDEDIAKTLLSKFSSNQSFVFY